MLYLALVLMAGASGIGSDVPATLHVDLVDGKSISFKLSNHYKSPVVKFQVEEVFEGNLACSLTVDVKRPDDLQPRGTCGLPLDVSTGKVASGHWKARIAYVEFADGMRWTPKD